MEEEKKELLTNPFDMIFYGWYQLLDKTVYLNTKILQGLDPIKHSFFISYFLHGLNLSTLFGYLYFKSFGQVISAYFSLALTLAVLIVGYNGCFKNGRTRIILEKKFSWFQTLLYVVGTLFYSGLSVYIMWRTGDVIRLYGEPIIDQ